MTLESTIIAFGLPYPENLKMAQECEDIIRGEGAVPATIGIIDGKLKIGLDEKELEQFAIRKDIVKTNLSNIAAVCARGIWGATSVSTSLMATSLAGIGVFVTGGIGGVHKGFGESFDISSDLTALSRYRAIVVSAGVKSLLDVRASLEYPPADSGTSTPTLRPRSRTISGKPAPVNFIKNVYTLPPAPQPKQ